MATGEKKLRWGIIGTGGIAKAFARGVAHSKKGELVGVASRTKEGAEKFGAEYNIPHRHEGYDALLADKDIDAVYIATPHPLHAEWAIKCAEAGKHILCEKPVTLNYYMALAVIEAARRNDVFFMEAYMYRCHPQTAKLVELLKAKEIGDVRFIQASFGFHGGFNPNGRLFNNALGGGGILDVGGYCTTMARLVAGVALGRDFAEPIEFKGSGYVGESRADEWASASLKFEGNIVASLSTGVSVNLDNSVRIFGTNGNIYIPTPWVPAREGGTVKIIVTKKGEPAPREILIETNEWLYGIEADTVADNITNREAKFPAMSWNDTLGNLKMQDMWREQIGMEYDAEKPEGWTQTIHRRPLAVKKGSVMKYGKVPGIDKPVSRLVMGVDNQSVLSQACIMFDDYYELGGNAFDTAYIYGGGKHESNLGEWIRLRNIREKVVILDKGAHTPFCNPVDLNKQFLESLTRLKTDYVDIYMMHRDNIDIPVGEFIDVLNEHVKAGRMRAFGASNWTIERIEAANEYAKKKGLKSFSAISNNLSLARMVNPVWGGSLSFSDPVSRAWLKKTQMPLMPWSSQARGFFVPERARPDLHTDKSLSHCWYSDDNFQRQARALELAKKKGVSGVTIACAYVLCQPFPTFPLIGPRTPRETEDSFKGLTVELTPEELLWLNLES
ncbi:MAG: aldo/keto reductase [Spirochaetes bacterium]|nr:aldo/keto reductase [Spirochaetota bacterium]